MQGQAGQKTLSSNQPKNPAQAQEAKQQKYHLEAEIDDVDGYTNVRSQPSIKGQIIDRVLDWHVFYTYHQDGNWWQVKTPNKKIGYMHISRIRLLN
ncbi:SH3 domain-containing protein [Motilimonas sp. KMU-193]|uniref:SH3 domain-containing protein n=1 Tax=Motilimonas sp. KMU-193 TaxID=3388668 RepID=UPI00396AF7B0